VKIGSWTKAVAWFATLVFLLLATGLIGRKFWVSVKVQRLMDQINIQDVLVLSQPRPVTLVPVVPLPQIEGNAAEDLITVYRHWKNMSPSSTTDEERDAVLWLAAQKSYCDWYVPSITESSQSLLWFGPSINIGGFRNDAKRLVAEASDLMDRRKYRDAERKLFIVMALGGHIKRHHTLMASMVGYSIETLGATQLLELYEAEGRESQRQNTDLYCEDLQKRILGAQKACEISSSSEGGIGLWSNSAGVSFTVSLMRQPGLADLLLGESLRQMAFGYISNPAEILFGPSAYRFEAIRSLMITHKDPAIQKIGQTAIRSLNAGFMERIRLFRSPYSYY